MKIRPTFLVASALVTLVFACGAPEATPGKADSNIEAKDKNEPKEEKKTTSPTDQQGGDATGARPTGVSCMDTCMAKTPSAPYGKCAGACEDEACGEKCFTDNCSGAKEAQCGTDEEKCATECAPTEEEITCAQTCVAGSVAKAYDACLQSKQCEDEACDQKCFTENCSGKEDQCDDAMEKCWTQCDK